MRRHSTAFRVVVTVVALVASLLTGAGSASSESAKSAQRSASSQPASPGELSSERVKVAEAKPGGFSATEECRMRGQRRHGGAAASQACPGCGRVVRVEPRSHAPAPFTGRLMVPPAVRSVDVPVRHQVFRC